jgi:hypothetical protein
MFGPEDQRPGFADIVFKSLLIGGGGVNVGVEIQRRQIQPACLGACFTGAPAVGIRQRSAKAVGARMSENDEYRS